MSERSTSELRPAPALAGTRNSSIGPTHEGLIRQTHRAMSERSYHGAGTDYRCAPPATREREKFCFGMSLTDNATINKERRKYFYLTMHSTHFIYSYTASDIWLRTILIVRKETCCHIGYSYRLTARVLLYAQTG